MEEARVRALIAELESPDENVRLRAANAFLGAQGEHLHLAAEALRQVYFGDANPAVKFLAKRALHDLGEELEATPSSEVLDTAQKVEEFQVVRDGKLLWKVAQEVLKQEVQLVLERIRSPHPDVIPALVHAVEKLGSALTAGPLVQSYLDREGVSVSAGAEDIPEAGWGLQAADFEEVLHGANLRHSGINPATAAAMGNLKVPEVFLVLVDMLGSRHPLMRRGALVALGELEDVMVVRPLLVRLGIAEPIENDRILEILGEQLVAEPRLRKPLTRELMARLGPGNPLPRRAWAARGLGRLQLTDAIDALRALLEDEQAEMRMEAVRALRGFDMPSEWLASNVRPLLDDPDPSVAAAAAAAHIGGTSSRYAEPVIERLRKSGPAKRAALAESLAWIDRPGIGDHLEPLLHDPDPEVRRQAIEAVKEIRTPAAAEFLAGLLTDEDATVAEAAVERVGALGMDQYNDLLVLLLDQASSPTLLATNLLALGRLGLPENVPTIGYYLNHEDPRVRESALRSLESTNDARATSLVSLSLTDPDHRVRASAASALWSFGELRCVETLRALLAGEVKEQAAGCRALGDMVARVRNERQLVDRPLLAAALRQFPRYAGLRRRSAV